MHSGRLASRACMCYQLEIALLIVVYKRQRGAEQGVEVVAAKSAKAAQGSN